MDKKQISQVMSELGKRSSEKLTPAQRKERATKAVMTRWEKYRKIKEEWQKTPRQTPTKD
jgi:uncharacterized protein YfbU (UPF0304 family)